MTKRLGIVPHAFARPLFHGLEDAEEAGRRLFHLTVDQPLELALQLRHRQLDGAFLSPIDYARLGAAYAAVPDIAAVSVGKSRSILLLTKGTDRPPARVAARLGGSSELVLAHLIIKEQFELAPTFVPLHGSPLEALDSADAVLLGGEEGYPFQERPGGLDLVNLWSEMTGLPFVHGLWVSPLSEGLTPSVIRILQDTAARAAAFIDDAMPPEQRAYVDQFYYHLDADASAGIAELFRMAFYHGMLKEVPDLRMFGA